MIKPNWGIFDAKFNENPQHNFEWFCYLLFCRKFNMMYGIFRYKNQAAIENDPINESGNVIGWQAKYYTNALSNHTDELLYTVTKAKDKYPEISKIYVFCNQEWGQYKGGKPKGQIAIEDKAEKLDITIIWKLTSFFESEFVTLECKEISKHFFSYEKSIFDAIEQQQKRSQNILYEINTQIAFKDEKIRIDRKGITEELINSKNNVSIVSGAGGIGKTAEIKILFERLSEKTPFFVFKAKEFELRSINELFKDYSYQDFLIELKKIETKYIIIDSAEKLLELNNTDPFKEFLSAILQDKWNIIFTTRENYLEILNYQFFEIFNIVPSNISIRKIDEVELIELSTKYNFTLPKDSKFRELISIPFYLKEYLKHYDINEDSNYTDFKNKLWKRTVRKTKPERERCLIKIATERANSGLFYVQPECDHAILDDELIKDGLLGYEDAGYFITHDIYEEWALEKYIKITYTARSSVSDFFDTIGSSLPIRRCFRNWLSDKIFENISEVQSLIDEIIQNSTIDKHWTDETIVSLLLSNNSHIFFKTFHDKITRNNCELFRDIVFIMRIACKEIDQDILGTLGLLKKEAQTLHFLMTKPKGNGWESAIKFAYENLSKIGIKNCGFIIPLLFDWNSKFKEGETTKYSSLISLKYYEWIESEDVYISNSDTKNKIIQTITFGALEIQNELETVIDKVLKHKWKHRKDPYYDLVHSILTEIHGLNVAKAIPKKTLLLANLQWTYTEAVNHGFYSYRDRDELEHSFCIEKKFHEYFPSSSFQTPIYFLLQQELLTTINFIIDFTNSKIEHFANSEYGKTEVEKVKVYIDENTQVEQYISNKIWCMYRGTQDAPNVLESIHMALERFFLEQGKLANSETLEYWLFYLLKKSTSSSISAIVASIVTTYPDKTFNVAACLFCTRLFFFYDLNRQQLDRGHKNYLTGFSGMYGKSFPNQLHDNDRIKSCDDGNRSVCLENICFNYQFFQEEGISNIEVRGRKDIIWSILDCHYEKIESECADDQNSEIWRLCLARMDQRKMEITTEKTESGTAIYFNPVIDDNLKQVSDNAQNTLKRKTKHLSLLQWATHRLKNEKEYEDYPQFEDNISLVFEEITAVSKKIRKIYSDEPDKRDIHFKNDFLLYNHSIPAVGYTVLFRDFNEFLSTTQLTTCKDKIIQIVIDTLEPSYDYSVLEKVEECFSVLPKIYKEFPGDRDRIKRCLLLTMFNTRRIGGPFNDNKFNDISLYVIKTLWVDFSNDIVSVLLGYLLLQSKYDIIIANLEKQHSQDMFHHVDRSKAWSEFINTEFQTFDLVDNNQVSISQIPPVVEYDYYALLTAFEIINQTQDNHIADCLAKDIIDHFAQSIFHSSRKEELDFSIRNRYLKLFSHYVLKTSTSRLSNVLESTIDNFKSSKAVAEMFTEFIYAEDSLNTYNNFWIVWDKFKELVIDLGKKGDGYSYIEQIIKSYLFSSVAWKEDADSWHSVKSENDHFFDDICMRIGHCPSVLFSMTMVLNGIGSIYKQKGIYWLSVVIEKLSKDNRILNTDTIFLLESYTRKFVFLNREEIKKKREMRIKVINALNLLIENGSVTGYMLRESIL